MNSEFVERLKEIKKRSNQKSFRAKDGNRISYLKFGDSGDSVFIFPGKGEPAIKYWELANELLAKDFSVYVLDHIGHGHSDHLLKGSGEILVHVDQFSRYVENAKDFYDEIVSKDNPKSIQLICHSMGSLIGCSMVMERSIDRIVLSSPMFGINTKGVPLPVSKLVASLLPSERPAPFQKPYNQSDIRLNQVTHCKQRALFFDALLVENSEVFREKVTNGWLKTALPFCDQFLDRCLSLKKKNFLVFQSGKDTFVRPERTKKFCQRVGCEMLVEVPKARHEILMEKNELRDPVIKKILEFLQKGKV